MTAAGVHERVVRLLQSWLVGRTGSVCVEGKFSSAFVLQNMVYQGTVEGPLLCNLFYADSKYAVHHSAFKEIVFADDLKSFKVFASSNNTLW